MASIDVFGSNTVGMVGTVAATTATTAATTATTAATTATTAATTATTAATTATTAATADATASNPVRKITFRELRQDVLEGILEACPHINIDDEMPQFLSQKLPPKTVGEWKRIGSQLNDYLAEEALEIFVNDEKASEEGYIVTESCVFFRRLVALRLQNKKTGFNHYYPGFSDEARRSINDDTPMTTKMENAILASVSRHKPVPCYFW